MGKKCIFIHKDKSDKKVTKGYKTVKTRHFPRQSPGRRDKDYKMVTKNFNYITQNPATNYSDWVPQKKKKETKKKWKLSI